MKQRKKTIKPRKHVTLSRCLGTPQEMIEVMSSGLTHLLQMNRFAMLNNVKPHFVIVPKSEIQMVDNKPQVICSFLDPETGHCKMKEIGIQLQTCKGKNQVTKVQHAPPTDAIKFDRSWQTVEAAACIKVFRSITSKDDQANKNK